MPMYEKCIRVAIIFILILLILFMIVAMNFFTKDNIKRDTIEKVSIAQMQGEEMYKKEHLITKQEEYQKITDVEISADIVDSQKELKDTKTENKKTSKQEESLTNTSKQSTITKTEKPITSNSVKAPTALNNVVSEYKGYSAIGKIEIPRTGINIPILSKVTVKGMDIAPCLLYSTGELNKSGNNLIVGHNFRNGKIFSNNSKLQIGDKIYITTLDGNRVEYTIYSKFTTTPEETNYLKRDTSRGAEITLSTCTNDENYRTIILAK